MPSFPQRIAALADAWMRRSGSSLKDRHLISALDGAVGSKGLAVEDRVLRAAACDLYDVLSASSEGRQALSDLGLPSKDMSRDACGVPLEA
jgi:hypothetical protein|nr:hypothetical protein 24 [Pseudomonadaceae bacterium]